MDSFPDWLNSTLASDAAEGQGVLPFSIRALSPNLRAVGPALVVLASRDDHQAVVQAVAGLTGPGLVLVVGGQSESRAATVGDLMALEMKNLGVAGLVTDGLVRDARELRELGFPVWCRGTTPLAPGKRGPGAVGGQVAIGGVLVRDDDLVIADEDGVVIWPHEEVGALLARAQARYESDNTRRAGLLQTGARRLP